MNRFSNIALSLVGIVVFQASGLAQSSTITTYAGRGHFPTGPTQAVTQVIDGPVAVIPDASGGFYFVSAGQHAIHRVSADGTLTVIAGTGTTGFSGDGGPALSAQLYGPTDVALDAAGNLFIADSGNYRIRKVSPNGVINTVAGIGTLGFSGDGGAAVSAQLNAPRSIAVDAAGNLFIAESASHRIRKVSPNGLISTFAGDGTKGFAGDGGPATAAQLNYPYGVTVDGNGNLFIADTNNLRIRKVTPDGVINTVAGNGKNWELSEGGPGSSPAIGAALDVAVDSTGNLFIVGADFFIDFLIRVTPEGLISSLVRHPDEGFGGDGGAAKAALLYLPVSVAVDVAGNLFIADYGNDRIRKIDLAGIITTVAGVGSANFSGDGGLASSADLDASNVTFDGAGNLWIAGYGDHRIRKVTPDGVIRTVAGSGALVERISSFSGDGGPATVAQLNHPAGLAVDRDGSLLIADTENNRIRKVSPAGVISTMAGSGPVGGGLGRFSGDGGPATAASLNYPMDVAVDTAGNLFIADAGNRRIRKVTPEGVISTVAGTGVPGFSGDGGPAFSAQFSFPASVAFDAAGNLFIADSGNNRIRKVTPDGVVNTLAGNGIDGFSGDGASALEAQLSGPRDVIVDATGNVLIADTGNHRIRKVTPDGIINTLAGNGISGFSGDFGPAASAQLTFPTGVVVDAEGNLFIADSGNRRIRKVATLMGPVLTLDSKQYRIGDSWTLKVGYGAPNTPVRLLGTSNGQSWEIPVWVSTDGSGSFKVEGTFAAGTEGSHALHVEIGGVFSNTIAFVVSSLTPTGSRP